jgi:hypothetical protein
MALIDLSYLVTNKGLSSNTEDADVYINDAELMDLEPLLGEALYHDILANENAPEYSVLIDGGDYTHNEMTIKCPGVKKVLAEYSAARITFFGNDKSTPFGFVEKNYNDARPIGRDRARERYTESTKIAYSLWSKVELYLNRNASDFDKWNNCSVQPARKNFNLRHIR